jgi:hypothetical protein
VEKHSYLILDVNLYSQLFVLLLVHLHFLYDKLLLFLIMKYLLVEIKQNYTVIFICREHLHGVRKCIEKSYLTIF